MDQSCSDLEFFDFNNVSEDEIKEIQAILKGPGSNGCVELPWEIPLKENCLEVDSQIEGTLEKTDVTSKGDKALGTEAGQALQFVSPQTPLSPPIARLPPAVETFVAPPTTIGPYANTPYFVSRTLPFVRAYPHMGVPFFACPLPGTGETNTMPTPYGQFVPIVPATVGQEKFVRPVDCDSVQKSRTTNDRQLNRRSKKKLSHLDYSFESENSDGYSDPATSEEQTPVSSPVSTVSSDLQTSVPLVPLPVPPSTFGVAGGTLPLHGYPPGLHTIPYTQMSGPQAHSAAMYYVPVFNHPYGSFIQSPSAPMVLPVNIRPGNESNEVCSEEVLKISSSPVLPAAVTKPEEISPNISTNCEVNTIAPEHYVPLPETKQDLMNPTAKNTKAEVKVLTDCNSSSDKLPSSSSKSINSSPDHIPKKVTIANEDKRKCQSGDEDSKVSSRDASRCWADLFKKPSPEVNGLDRQLTTDQEYESLSNLNKEVSNGKLYTVPVSDNII